MIIKLSATDALVTASKIAAQKTAEASGDLIGNNIANRITKVSKNSQQNNSKIVQMSTIKKMPKERYLPCEERRLII